MLRAISLNPNGLASRQHRSEIFGSVRALFPDLVLWEETGSAEKDTQAWSRELGEETYQSVWSPGQHHWGVGLSLRRSSVTLKELLFVDDMGRALMARVSTVDYGDLLVVVAYNPPAGRWEYHEAERREFIEHGIPWHYVQDSGLPVLMAGDWNCVESAEDKQGAPFVMTATAVQMVSMAAQLDLVDPWRRVGDPQGQWWTHAQTVSGGNKSLDRKDRFYLSASLAEAAVAVKHHVCTSDHAVVELLLQPVDVPTGPGLWKLNATILTPNRVELVRQMLDDFRSDPRFESDTSAWWDAWKERLVTYLRTQSKLEADARRLRARVAKARLIQATRVLASTPEDPTALQEFNEAHGDLQELERYAVQGARLRSRARWLRHGERPSAAYFRALAYRRKRQFFKLVHEANNGTIGHLLDKVHRYYSELYSLRRPMQHKVVRLMNHLRSVQRVLSHDELERPLTAEELQGALEQMASDKAPGVDGLTVNLYKACPFLLEPLIKVWRDALAAGQLPDSMRVGVVSLLFKNKGDPASLDNWRPITLLCTDYKIIAKALALRLAEVIKQLVGPNQTGFIGGRYILTNVLEAQLALGMCKTSGTLAAFTFYDFEKAYDRLGLDFLLNVLEAVGLEVQFRSMVAVLIANAVVHVLVNGFLTAAINILSGVRQGCPIAPLLFALATEALRLALELCRDIGLQVRNVHLHASMYADDLTTYNGSAGAFQRSHQIVLDFCEASCMRLNLGKCRALVVGRGGDNRAALEAALQQVGITLMGDDDSERLLGSVVGRHTELAHAFHQALEKMQERCTQLSRSGLTVFGRALAANALCTSKILYTAQVSYLPTSTLERVWSLTNRFVDGKACFRSRVRYNYRYYPLKQGGLGLVDVRSLIPASQAMWVVRFLTTQERHAPWRALFLEAVVDAAAAVGCKEPFLHWPVVQEPRDFISSVLYWWKRLGPSLDPGARSPFPKLGRRSYHKPSGRFRYTTPPLDQYNPGRMHAVRLRGCPLAEVSTNLLYHALLQRSLPMVPQQGPSWLVRAWVWLHAPSSVVPTTTRQFLWRLWHRKLYFGEKRGAEQVPCSFAGLEGASCTAYMSVAHLTSECPTVALCLAYFERCWFEWCGTRTTRDHIQEFTAPDDCRSRDQWRWSLALLLHMLWRSRCCGHLAVPRKKVTAMVVIKAWQGELALQLRLAFLGRSFPDLWRVRGGWARMVDDRVRVQISWPPVSDEIRHQHERASALRSIPLVVESDLLHSVVALGN